MTQHSLRRADERQQTWWDHVDLFSAAVLFLAVVGLALVFLGIFLQGSSWYWVIPPALLAALAISKLRRS